jgi:hypothetical protein
MAVTANTTKDLTSGTSYLVFTADATEGGIVNFIRARPMGTNALSVARLFINNGSTTGTATNNALIDELVLAATTNIETAAIAGTQFAGPYVLPPGYRLYITVGTAVTGWEFTTFGAKL